MKKKAATKELNSEPVNDDDIRTQRNEAHLKDLSMEEKEIVKLLALIFVKSIVCL